MSVCTTSASAVTAATLHLALLRPPRCCRVCLRPDAPHCMKTRPAERGCMHAAAAAQGVLGAPAARLCTCIAIQLCANNNTFRTQLAATCALRTTITSPMSYGHAQSANARCDCNCMFWQIFDLLAPRDLPVESRTLTRQKVVFHSQLTLDSAHIVWAACRGHPRWK